MNVNINDELDLLHIYSNPMGAAMSSPLGVTVANQLCILNPPVNFMKHFNLLLIRRTNKLERLFVPASQIF